MKRSKIEWVEDCWNPITGCLYECQYCYARKHSRRFTGDVRKNLVSLQYEKKGELFVLNKPFFSETGAILNCPFGFQPTYHKYRLNYPNRRKNGSRILVGEAGELFGEWIPDKWLSDIFEVCKQYDQHKYFFITRNPTRYKDLYNKGILPIDKNFWYGSTVTSNIAMFPNIPIVTNTFMCIEPIQEKVRMPTNDIRIADWIIVGAETGNGREKIIPKREWIDIILEYVVRVKIPIFMKESLREIMGVEMKQEYPPELLEKEISPKVKERLEGKCCRCGASMRKNTMIALCARFKRGKPPKQYAHICKPCFVEQCQEYSIEIPELAERKEETRKYD